MAIPATGSAEGKEIYITRTVPVGPSSITVTPTVDAYNVEDGISVDLPIAGDSNRSGGLQLAVSGTVLDADKSKFEFGANKLQIEMVESGIIYTAGGKPASVARFTVLPADESIARRVTGIWNTAVEDVWNAAIPTFPDAETYEFNIGQRVAPVETYDGRLLVFCVAKITGSSPANYRILGVKYDQAAGENISFGYIARSDKLCAGGLELPTSGATLNEPLISAVEVGKNIYIAIAHKGTTTPSNTSGTVYIFTVSLGNESGTYEITKVSDDIAQFDDTTTLIDGGISLTYAAERLVLAAGICKGSISEANTYQRGVALASSRDFKNWDKDTAGLSPFAFLGDLSTTLQLEDGDSVTDMDILERGGDKNFICAVTRLGDVYTSLDYGSSWSKADSVSGKHKVPLGAVKIIYSNLVQKFIIYTAGHRGFIQRSIDDGQTFRIIAVPHDFKKFSFSTTDDFENFDATKGYETVPTGSSISNIVAVELGAATGIAQTTQWDMWFADDTRVLFLEHAEKIDASTPLRTSEIKTIASFSKDDSIIRDMIVIKRFTDLGSGDESYAPELLLAGSFRAEENPYTAHIIGTYRKSTPWTPDDGWSCSKFCRIKNANSIKNASKSTSSGYFFSTDQASQGATIATIMGVVRITDTVAFAVDSDGHLVRWQADSSTTHMSGAYAGQPTITVRDISEVVGNGFPNKNLYSIAVWFKDPGTQVLFIGDMDGVIYRTTDDGQTFSAYAGYSAVTSLLALSEDAVLVGGWQSHTLRRLVVVSRTYPELLTLANGNILLACANMSEGKVEVWRATDITNFLFNFSRVLPQPIESDGETSGALEPISFPAEYVDAVTVTNSMQPAMCQTADGLVALFAGNRSIVSIDHNGGNWIDGNSSKLPLPILPLSNYFSTVALERNRTPAVIQYGGGRLFAFITQSTGTYETTVGTAWRWVALGDSDIAALKDYVKTMPIMSGGQWLGVANVKAYWLGQATKGDTFDIGLKKRYGTNQLAKESPSFPWRAGDSSENIGAEINLYWNRKDSAIVDVLGNGRFWNVNCLALFGIDVPYIRWAISSPTYTGSTFPTDRADYTEFFNTSVIHEGVFFSKAAQVTAGTYAPIIRDGGVAWLPNEWAPGTRTYYVLIMKTSAPAGYYIRKIVSNTHNTIMYDGDGLDLSEFEGDPGGGATLRYAIFADRIFADGSIGTRVSEYGNPQPNLVDTIYEYGQWLRITIPQVFASSHDYCQIGTALFGRMTPITVKTPSGPQKRHKYSRGWRWAALPPTNEETTIGGVTHVRHLARPGQLFKLEWNEVEKWETDVFFNLLMPDIKQAFGILMDGNNPNTLELVRINNLSDVSHAGGTLFTRGVELLEVK